MGSSSYITNLDGEVVQHIEYVPFGEVFLEEKNAKWNTPYLFNSKELDKETGLYYFGARYYDPKTSVWASVDPLAVYNPVLEEEFYYDGDHNGGAYNDKNLNTYGYCYQNPVALIDPTGKQVYFMTPPTERISPEQASISVDLIPVVGDVKGVLEGAIGYDILGNKLSTVDRLWSLALLSEVKVAKKTGKIIEEVKDVSKMTKLKKSAEVGQEAHRQIQAELNLKGAEIEVPLKLKGDKKVRKDAIKSDGTAVIIKPDTPSGQKSAKTRENLMKKNNYKTETIYYDPKNPAYQPGSPTYIGPKKK